MVGAGPSRVMVHLRRRAPDKRPFPGAAVFGALVRARMVRLNHGRA